MYHADTSAGRSRDWLSMPSESTDRLEGLTLFVEHQSLATSHSKEQSTSPELTGGTGFTFEDTVVAYYLAALLREEGATGQDGLVTSVAVQQSAYGYPLDDLVVEFTQTSSSRRLSLQLKRRVVISAAPSNTEFRQIITASKETRSATTFQKDIDTYGFAVEHVATQSFRALQRIIDWAKSSPTPEIFSNRFVSTGTAAATERRIRESLLPLIRGTCENDEVNFYRHFKALHLGGFTDDGVLRAEVVNRLQELVVSDKDNLGLLLFDRLCRIARLGAGTSRTWTRHALLTDLHDQVRLKVIPRYKTDIDVLNTLSLACMEDLSDDITGFQVDRLELEESILKQLTKCRLVNIGGLPGCGKSAMLKSIARNYIAKGPILFLTSDRLTGASWLSFAHAHGLQILNLSGLLTEIESAGTPILFIDGIDRVSPNQKAIITDILRTIATHQHLADWKVIASSRNQGLEAYRSWFPVSFYRDQGFGDVSVGSFNDTEARVLANAKPGLARLLFGPAPVREIARRPFFASVLARNLQNESQSIETEVDLIAEWWDRGGHDAPEEVVPERQRALLDLADKSVRTLGRNISSATVTNATIGQIAALKADYVIREHDGGAFFSFAHDIFFEWVFFRFLIQCGPDWHVQLIDAGEPPLLGRVVGLLAQHALRSPERWSDTYRNLEAQDLRPQWRREWLTAPLFTQEFTPDQGEFEALVVEDDYAILDKLLVWFQAQHTMPSPMILQSGSSLPDGVDPIEMADRLGWPSDVQAWGRFLDWILARLEGLPTRLLPKVIELFSVWQNLFAQAENSRSGNILEFCSTLLAELDGPVNSETTVVPTTRSMKLSSTNLVTSLRFLILRSASTYPQHTTALYQRAITSARIRRDAYIDLVTASPITTKVDAGLLVDIAKAELLEELPNDQLDRLRRERQEYFHALKSVRTASEQTGASVERPGRPYVPSLPNYREPDPHDIGINRYHRYYFPPSPLHEPFASLFTNRPQAAVTLVRDLANHATSSWRQIQAIKRDRMGTPISVTLAFPWGRQDFWGDWQVYGWFMGDVSSHPMECAFLSLSYWSFTQIDAGRPTDEVIHEIVEGNECYAILGLALTLALETLHVSEATLPLVTCQRLWRHDITRRSQEYTRGVDPLGIADLTRLTGDKARAKEYLDTRTFRSRDIRDLAMQFMVSPDKSLRKGIKDALAEFPTTLPYEIEENRSDRSYTEALKEDATRYAAIGDIGNYRQHTVDGDKVVVTYQPTVLSTSQQSKELAASGRYIQETVVTGWAMKSLAERNLGDDIDLAEVSALAKARDDVLMFRNRRSVGDHTTQDMIAAVAACVICFRDSSSPEYGWALDVLRRIEGMTERSEVHYESALSSHPTCFLIAGLARLRMSKPADMELARRLMRLTSYPLREARDLALAALFRDPDLTVAWTTLRLAINLSVRHRPTIREDGSRDHSANQMADRKDLTQALTVVGTNQDLISPPFPPAWVKMGKTIGQKSSDVYASSVEEVWDEPDPSFNAVYAARHLRHFPMESFCRDDVFKQLVEVTLKRFVVWTSDRLIPSWEDQERRSHNSGFEHVDWTNLLGDYIARAAPYFEPDIVVRDFLAPSLVDDEDALQVLASFVDSTVCRQVFDAQTIPGNTFPILDLCVDRLVHDPTFASSSYRSGEVHGDNLPRLIKALLFVSVEKADGAERFANGDWSEVGLVMPIVTRIVAEVGWSLFVMDNFLTLCERAGKAYPIGDFSVQIGSVLGSMEDSRGTWSGTTIPARIAGIVQRLADENFPLQDEQARDLLTILDSLIDLGDRRSVALEGSEAFRGVQRGMA